MIRRAAFCALALVLAGCGTPTSPPEAARGAVTPRETAHSTSTCEGPCTPTRTSSHRPNQASTPSASAPASTAGRVLAAPAPSARINSTSGPYSRDAFGSGWADPDRNGCDARQDAVARATTNRVYDGKCRIVTGDVFDRYSGRTYKAARTSSFDIDHVVSLHDAWESGAYKWTRAKRVAYANDPSVLVLTTASANRSKSDQGPDTWAPISHDGACWYVRTYRNIKRVYALHTTGPQRAAIRHTLATCNGTEGR